MTIKKSIEYYVSIVKELCKFSSETEWVEFKHNIVESEEIGEYISALSNSAALNGKINAYIVWGIENKTHEIIGTSFKPGKTKIGNEELENWLLCHLSPKIDFSFYSLGIENKQVVLLEINSAFRHPVRFKNIEYIRVGSYRKKLKDFPEKERELWRVFDKIPFEGGIAIDNLDEGEVLALLDYPAYFTLLNIPLPETRENIIKTLKQEYLIWKGDNGKWNINNLGAVLFANDINNFHSLKRKAVRIIQYKSDNRMETIREQVISKGYAC